MAKGRRDHAPKRINRQFNSPNKSTSPCLGCRDRTLTCHAAGNCNKYDKYKEKVKEETKREKQFYKWY